MKIKLPKTPSHPLQDKTIVLAGSQGLIGRTLFQVLNSLDAAVIPADINAAIPYNLRNEYDISRLLDYDPDVFINAAYPPAISDHLFCFLDTAEAFADHMATHSGGSIVLFSSIYAKVGPDYRSYSGTDMDAAAAYSAVKGAINAAVRTLATKYAHAGVRANSIVAGGVSDNQPYSFVEDYNRRTPMGRMARPEDFVGPVVFLADGTQSGYITGQNLVVDGGLTIW